jgi:hypothetical protein
MLLGSCYDPVVMVLDRENMIEAAQDSLNPSFGIAIRNGRLKK